MNPVILAITTIVALLLSVFGISPLLRRMLMKKYYGKKAPSRLIWRVFLITFVGFAIGVTALIFIFTSEILLPQEVRAMQTKIRELEKQTDDFQIYIGDLDEVQDIAIAEIVSLGLESFGNEKYDEAVGYFNAALVLVSDTTKTRLGLLSLTGVSQGKAGNFTEASVTFEEMSQLSNIVQDTDAMANVLVNGGYVYHQLNKLQKALDYYRRGLKIAENRGDSAIQLTYYLRIASVYEDSDSLKRALYHYEHALGIAEHIDNLNGQSEALSGIGRLHQRRGESYSSEKFFEEALEVAEEANDSTVQVVQLRKLGLLYKLRGEYEEALKYYIKALKIQEQIGTVDSQLLSTIGDIYLKLGNSQKALKFYRRSLERNKQLNNKEGMAKDFNRIGNVYRKLKEWDSALEYFNLAFILVGEQKGNIDVKAYALWGIGDAYQTNGQLNEALESYRRARKFAQQIGDPEVQANVIGGIANIYQIQGDSQKALEYYRWALKFEQQIDDLELKANIIGGMGHSFEALDSLEQACDYYSWAHEIAKTIGDEEMQARQYVNLGALYRKQDDFVNAISGYKKALALYGKIGDEEKVKEIEDILSRLEEERHENQ